MWPSLAGSATYKQQAIRVMAIMECFLHENSKLKERVQGSMDTLIIAYQLLLYNSFPPQYPVPLVK